jgi:hypothetical protein
LLQELPVAFRDPGELTVEGEVSAEGTVQHVVDDFAMLDVLPEVLVEFGEFIPEDGDTVDGEVFRCQCTRTNLVLNRG